MFFCACVRMTTNGVVVRHQVLSPGGGVKDMSVSVWWERTARIRHGRKVQQRNIYALVWP